MIDSEKCCLTIMHATLVCDSRPRCHHQHSQCPRPPSLCIHLLRLLASLMFIVTTISCNKHSQSLIKNEENPSFASQIENVTSVLGRSATLECVVDNLGPYNKVAWLKMDSANKEGTVLTIGTQVLFNENKYRVTNNGARQWYLHIKHVRPSDRGYYMCQVNAKNMISQTGFLDVQIPPIMLEDRTSVDTTVDELQKAVLRCGAKGYPRPKITWRREDAKPLNLGLFGGKQYSAQTFEGDQLNLTQVTRDDMGAYLCIASNGVPPSLSKRILLHVNFRPKIRVQNQLIDARLGESVELVCICEAYPRPMVTWITPSGHSLLSPSSSASIPAFVASNDSTLKSPAVSLLAHKYSVEEDYHGYKTTMRLKINSLSRDDFGGFKCFTKNTMGEKEGLIRLYESQSSQLKTAMSNQKQAKNNLQTSKKVKANRLKSRKSIKRNKTNNADVTADTAEDELEASEDDEDNEGEAELATGSSWNGAPSFSSCTTTVADKWTQLNSLKGIIPLMLYTALALSINAVVECFNLY